MKVRDLILIIGGWTFVKISDSDYEADDNKEDNILKIFNRYSLYEATEDEVHWFYEQTVKYSEISFDEDYDIILTIYI